MAQSSSPFCSYQPLRLLTTVAWLISSWLLKMLLVWPSECGLWCGIQGWRVMLCGTPTKGGKTVHWGTPMDLTGRISSGVAAKTGRRPRRPWRGFQKGNGIITGLIHAPEGRNVGTIHKLCGAEPRELGAPEWCAMKGGVFSWLATMILLGIILVKDLTELLIPINPFLSGCYVRFNFFTLPDMGGVIVFSASPLWDFFPLFNSNFLSSHIGLLLKLQNKQIKGTTNQKKILIFVTR